MPQNSNLNSEWRKMLGDNWKEVQRIYLHTIGNLTLTGYNSEMSDRSFNDKLNHDKGLKNSHIKLNHDIADLCKWDGFEILKRTENLAQQVISIWKYPSISQSDINEYMAKDKVEQVYTSIEHYPVMDEKIYEIYFDIDKKILNLDSGIEKKYNQQYIAYKIENSFANIRISKSQLTIGLNIPFDIIKDDMGECSDTTNVGNFANVPVLFKLDEKNKIDYAMKLIEQALKYQAN